MSLLLFDFYKGQEGVIMRPISYAAKFIKFAEMIKTMEPGYKL